MRIQSSQFLLIFISLLAINAYGQRDSDIRYITISQGTNLSIAVDPQERFIIHDLQGALYKMDIDGGSAQPITDYYMDARQPSLSSDGTTVYFQSYQNGNWHIWSVGTDGSELRQLTSGQYDYREPAVQTIDIPWHILQIAMAVMIFGPPHHLAENKFSLRIANTMIMAQASVMTGAIWPLYERRLMVGN